MSAVQKFRGLTGLRGIAAWWVVLYHIREVAGWRSVAINNGYLAVDLFFILSGFIIALNYAHLFRSIATPNYLHFIGVRLARIYPLHVFMLCLFLLNPLAIVLLADEPLGRQYNPLYFVLSVFLVQNWGFTTGLDWNVPSWSISTEFAAYLLFPLIALTSNTFLKSKWRCLTAMAVLLLILGLGVAITTGGIGRAIPRIGLFRCVVEFTLGVCLYSFWVKMNGRGSYIALALSALCIAVYFVFPVPDFAIVPLGMTLLIYALTDERLFLSRLLAAPPLEYTGLVSYSTYMFHFFALSWAKFILVQDYIDPLVPTAAYLLATAIGSVVLYHYVEVPGRRLGRIWADHISARRRSVDATAPKS